MFIGLSTAITNALGTPEFNPSTLFASATGYIYDLNDLTTVFQDSAGTTPASVNGLVGLVFDLSKGLAIGSEIVPNGTFDNATGWTVPVGWAISGGVATATATGSSLIQSSAPAVAGRWYKVEFDWTHTGGTLFVRVGAGPAAQFNTSGRKVCYLLANSSAGVEFYGGFVSGTLDNLTAKPIAGNHRYQGTTGSKPILRGTPTGLNLFASYGTPGSGWADSGSGVATATASAASIPTNVVPSASRVYRVRYTATVTSGTVRLTLGGQNGVTRSASGTYEEYIAATSAAALSFQGVSAFTGTVSAIDVRDVSADSVTTPYALQYDGADDFLQTASVNFTATDKMTVCHGVRKLSDAAVGMLLELSANWNVNNGTFNIAAPNAAGTYDFATKGTTNVVVSRTGFTAPNTSVLTFHSDISAPSFVTRVSGVASTPSTSSQGTGNYGNYPLYFGRRGGTVLPFNGLEYSSVCIGRLLTAAELANTERWVGRKTGISL